MATIGKLTIDLDFKITLWQAVKLRIAGKGLAQRLVDDFIMRRMKELETRDTVSFKDPPRESGERGENWGGLKTEGSVRVKGV